MTDDPLRAYFALKDRALAEAATMRRADDPRDVRAASKALGALLAEVLKVAGRLPPDLSGAALSFRVHGLGLIEKAKVRAERLEKEGGE